MLGSGRYTCDACAEADTIAAVQHGMCAGLMPSADTYQAVVVTPQQVQCAYQE
jgi:hypothetical protein